MAVKVTKESPRVTAEFGGLLEECVFCKSKTAYWHNATNTPICRDCAKDTHLGLVHEVKGEAIMAAFDLKVQSYTRL